MKLLIYGYGPAADVALAESKLQNPFLEFQGFLVDDDFVVSKKNLEYPVHKFSNSKKIIKESKTFVAAGYKKLNKNRQRMVAKIINVGGRLISITPKIPQNYKTRIGKNCLILRGCSIQPFVKIGDNVFVWSNAALCHHVEIGSHVWITAGAVLAGNSKIGSNIFIGANATVANNVSIGNNCFIGANAFVNSDLPCNSVVIQPGSSISKIKASTFVDFLDKNIKY